MSINRFWRRNIDDVLEKVVEMHLDLIRVSRVVLVALTFLCPVIAQNVRIDVAKRSTAIPRVCQSLSPTSLDGTIDVPALVKEAICKGAGDMMADSLMC